MELTKEQARKETIELWTILAETGTLTPYDVPGPWEKYENCDPLCEYAEEDCSNCPVVDWAGARTVEERKKYAREVLEKLKGPPARMPAPEGADFDEIWEFELLPNTDRER